MLFYRKTASPPGDEVHTGQMRKAEDFAKEVGSTGLLQRFKNESDLRTHLYPHLLDAILVARPNLALKVHALRHLHTQITAH